MTCVSPDDCAERRMCNCANGVEPGMRKTPTAELWRTRSLLDQWRDIAPRPAFVSDAEEEKAPS